MMKKILNCIFVTLTIWGCNDDFENGKVRFEQQNYFIKEGESISVGLIMSSPYSEEITFTLVFYNDDLSYTRDVDLLKDLKEIDNNHFEIILGAGQTTQKFNITANDDSEIEGDEVIEIGLFANRLNKNPEKRVNFISPEVRESTAKIIVVDNDE